MTRQMPASFVLSFWFLVFHLILKYHSAIKLHASDGQTGGRILIIPGVCFTPDD
jgi:hypothetical protein